MNRAFEAALAARWLWMDVRCLESIGGLESEVEAAVQAAYAAVEQLAAGETFGFPRYGANVPPLLLDVPQLAEHYKLAYESYLEAEREWIQEMEYQQELEQHWQDLADTYAEIDRDLIAGWKADCLDDDLL
jgi:hypothetical protein